MFTTVIAGSEATTVWARMLATVSAVVPAKAGTTEEFGGAMPPNSTGRRPYSAASRISARSALTAQNLNSGILPKGSSAGLVNRFAAASA